MASTNFKRRAALVTMMAILSTTTGCVSRRKYLKAWQVIRDCRAQSLERKRLLNDYRARVERACPEMRQPSQNFGAVDNNEAGF